MSVTAERVRHPAWTFTLGVITGMAVAVALCVAGLLAWRWLVSAFSGLDLTESDVQASALDAYLASRSIPAGSSVSVIAEKGDCDRWVATLRIHRPADEPWRNEIADVATFQVNNDSGQAFAHERPGMSADEVRAEMCG
jgi:hypothetical protein